MWLVDVLIHEQGHYILALLLIVDSVYLANGHAYASD